DDAVALVRQEVVDGRRRRITGIDKPPAAGERNGGAELAVHAQFFGRPRGDEDPPIRAPDRGTDEEHQKGDDRIGEPRLSDPRGRTDGLSAGIHQKREATGDQDPTVVSCGSWAVSSTGSARTGRRRPST